MDPDVEQHVMYGIGNAPIRNYPYPHFYLENVFPDAFYREILDHLPELEVLHSHVETGRVKSKGAPIDQTDHPYMSRYSLTFNESELDRFDPLNRDFWRELSAWLQSEQVITFVLQKFAASLRQRFKESLETVRFYSDTQLIRDFTNYGLGPHSDSPRKVAVLIFYLPATADNPHLGTSIYVPKDPTFGCEGGPHYPYDGFKKVATMEYKPNSAFGFCKSSNSFHGVEPIVESDVQRDLIQFSISHVMGDR